ncbi:MAG: hypothetical protein ABI972_10775 [Acidobacteriota bacterium]
MTPDRMRKLARALDLVAEKDRQELARQEAIEQMRREAALELYGICRKFVDDLNLIMEQVRLELSPADYACRNYNDNGPNLFQINLHGRLIQITFKPTDTVTSTDNYRIPYTLEGTVNSFNQQLLELDEIRDQRLYFCLERSGNHWRFQEGSSGKQGVVDSDYLAGLLEKLT